MDRPPLISARSPSTPALRRVSHIVCGVSRKWTDGLPGAPARGRSGAGVAETQFMRLGSRPTSEHPAETAAPVDALLEQVVEQRCCDACRRVPLIGERVGIYSDGSLRCELCATVTAQRPVSESIVRHQPDGPRSRVRVIRQLPQ